MRTVPSLCLAFLIAAAAAPAIAAHDWEYMTTRADGTLIAVAPATFARTGDRATAIFRFRQRNADWYNLVGADCRSGGVFAMRLAETGPTLTKAPRALPTGAAYHPAVQGSVGAWLIGAMCRDAATSGIQFQASGISGGTFVLPAIGDGVH